MLSFDALRIIKMNSQTAYHIFRDVALVYDKLVRFGVDDINNPDIFRGLRCVFYDIYSSDVTLQDESNWREETLVLISKFSQYVVTNMLVNSSAMMLKIGNKESVWCSIDDDSIDPEDDIYHSDDSSGSENSSIAHYDTLIRSMVMQPITLTDIEMSLCLELAYMHMFRKIRYIGNTLMDGYKYNFLHKYRGFGITNNVFNYLVRERYCDFSSNMVPKISGYVKE